ncbi:MAG: hypothetical protein AAF604_14025 [Acidobacteriota bacterium]
MRPGILATALLLLSAACSLPPTPDQLFDDGRLGAAAAAYEAILVDTTDGIARERAAFRLALIYELPAGPRYAPEKSLALLEELAAVSDSPYGRQARQLLAGRKRIERLRRSLFERRDRIHRLHAEIQDLLVELAEHEARLSEELEKNQRLDDTVEQLEGRLSSLRGRLDEHRREADRLSIELEKLKEIDLLSPP